MGRSVEVAPGVLVMDHSREKFIKRPISPDGLVGYDQFDQLAVTRMDGEFESSHFIADVREKICPLCLRGWELSGPGMDDQMHWQLIDGHVHESCYVRHVGFIERSEFWGAICDARVRFKGFTAIENGYWPKAYRISGKPWYRAELTEHPAAFILGSRKRVDHIEVVPTEGELRWHREAEKFFAGTDVTKHFRPDSVLLHAWTTEKMREYIKQLSQIAGFCVKL